MSVLVFHSETALSGKRKKKGERGRRKREREGERGRDGRRMEGRKEVRDGGMEEE